MRTCCVLISLLLLTSLAVVAQTSGKSEPFDQWKLYGGYQFTSLDSHAVQDAFNLARVEDPTFPVINFGERQKTNGWDAGFQEDVTKWFGVVVDVSGGYTHSRIDLGTIGGVKSVARTNASIYTITGGPQFTLRHSDNVQPFVRVLLGGAFFNSSSNVLDNNVREFPVDFKENSDGFAYGGGLGSDFFFSRKAGIRVSVDYLHTPFFDDAQNNFRGDVGLVVRF